MRIAILILAISVGCYFAYAASTKIEDNETSGYKLDIDKVGGDYAISVIKHSNKYMITNKDDDATPNYYGFVAADESWYIIKETVSAGADTYDYDSGETNYSTNWDSRSSLTYQDWNLEF